jgi:hypothetical protein
MRPFLAVAPNRAPAVLANPRVPPRGALWVPPHCAELRGCQPRLTLQICHGLPHPCVFSYGSDFPTPLRGITLGPSRSALTCLVLIESPPLLPTRCHPDCRHSAVPELGISYCACLAVGSCHPLRSLTLPRFHGFRWLKIPKTLSYCE